MAQKIRSQIFLILTIIFFLPLCFGIFHSGLFTSDDGSWMVIRFSAFYDAIRHGQFPVRFLPRLLNGYGYPVADFLYPLFMYIGVLFKIIGLNFILVIKVIFALSFLFSGIFSFFWLRKSFSHLASFIGAVSYVYFPYHVWDMYKRGSLGEVLAMAIFPFIFWQIDRKSTVLTALGISLLIVSHNTLALLFLPVVVGYLFMKRFSIKKSIISLFLGLGISAFFWIPALYDKQYTVFDKTAVSNAASYFVTTNLYFVLGVITLLTVGAGIWFVFKKDKTQWYFAKVFLLSLLLSFPISSFVWQHWGISNFIQFPFRFLSLTAISSSFLLAFALENTKKSIKLFLSLVVLFFIFISSFSLLIPKTYQYFPVTFYSTNEDSTTVKNEYLPKWVKEVPVQKKSDVEFLSGKGEIISQKIQGTNGVILLKNSTESLLQINIIYFPGWIVKIDNNVSTISYQNPSGLMRITVPSGEHILSFSFTETPVRKMADMLSILTILVMVGSVIKKYAKIS